MEPFYENESFVNSRVPVKVLTYHLEEEAIYIPLHWHRSIEVCLVFKGCLAFCVEGHQIFLRAGQYLILNAESMHSVHYIPEDGLTESITVLISYEFISSWSPLSGKLYFFNANRDDIDKKIKLVLENIAVIHEQKSEYSDLELSAKVHELMLLLLKNCASPSDGKKQARNEANFKRVRQAVEYIERNYKEPVSLESIAIELNLSPVYFSRYFKEQVGENYYDYLGHIRLSHAMDELSLGGTTNLDCALNNGFPNVKAFLELFKKMYGCTPGQYRKLHYPKK